MHHLGADHLATNQSSFWSTLLQGLTEGVAVLDTGNRLVYCNPVFETITGQLGTAFIGQPVTALFPGLQLPAPLSPSGYIQEVRSNGQGVLSLRVMPSLNAQGEIHGSLITLSHAAAQVPAALLAEKSAVPSGKGLEPVIDFSSQIMELLPCLIAVYNIQTGQYVYLNQAATKILGYEPDEILRNGLEFFLSLIHPDDKEQLLEKNQEAIRQSEETYQRSNPDQTDVVYFEYRLRHADGTWRWLHTTGTVFDRDPAGKILHILNISIDITGRKEAEEKLTDSEAQLRECQEIGQIGSYNWDMVHNRLFWSEETYRIFGLPPGAALNYEKGMSAIHPEDLLRLQKATEDVLSGEGPFEYEFRVVHSDGTIRYVWARARLFFDDQRHPVRLTGSVLDITELKKTEEKLLESQHLLQQIADTSPDHLYVFDLAESKLVYVNREITDTLGFVPEDLYGMGDNLLSAVMHPDDLKEAEAHIAGFATAKDGELREIEYRIRDVQGQWHWILARETVFRRDKSGVPVQITGVSRDITTTKLAGQQLRQNEEQLRLLNAELEQRVTQRTAALAESEERYRVFVQQSSEAIWRFELEGIACIPTSLPENQQIELFYKHGYLAECNDTMAQMYGYAKAEDIIGVGMSDMIPSSDPANVEYLKKFIRSDYRLTNAESVEIDVQGNIKYFMNNLLGILENGNLVRAWGIQRDITDRKQAGEALREKELEYRSLVTATAQIIWYTNGEGLVFEPQPLWERYTGQSREDTTGYGWLNAVHPEEYERVLAAWQWAVERQQVYESEFRIRSKTKEYRWFSVRGVPVFSKHGTVRKWIGTCSDVHERRQALEALRESEERFNLAVKAADIGIFDWHIPTGQVVWSEQEQRLFGVIPGSFEGTIEGWASKVLPEDLELVQKELGHYMDQRKTEMDFQFRIRRPDNEIRWIDGSGRFIYSNEGTPLRMVGVNIDVTERKLAEDALRKSEVRFRRLFESDVVGIVFVDATGTITDANNAFLRIVGYSRQELEVHQLNWRQITPPEYAGKDDQALRELLDHQWVPPFEKECFHKNGSRVPVIIGAAVLPEGEIGASVAVVLDISEQKKARQQLALSEERFRLVAKATNEGIWDWDITTDKVWRNDNYYTIFGFSGQELDGTYSDFDNRIHPDDAEAVRLSIGEAFLHRQDYWSKEYRIARSDGSYAFILDRAYIMYDESSHPIRMIGSKLDLSGQREAQAALEKQAIELKRYNADLEQFAYISSHDLQEPLNIASSFAKLLKRRYLGQLDQDADDFINYIADSTDLMRQMIRSLLEYSRITSTEKPKESVNLAEVAAAVIKNYQGKITESEAVVEYGFLPTVFANHSQMTKLFQHLLDNAIKFRSQQPLSIQISAQDKHDHWLIAFRDTGIGMEMEDARNKIFEVFQRLHPREAYQGTGIGLAICKKIVERHGGSIWAESQPGKGTVIYFTLQKQDIRY